MKEKLSMKELIKSYQENGNNDVIERVLEYVDEDLTKYGYDEKPETINDVDGLIYIAIKIRAYLLKDCFRERNFRFKYQSNAKDKADYKALFGSSNDNDFYDERDLQNQNTRDWGDNDGFTSITANDSNSYWLEDLADNPWLGVNIDELREYNFSSIWRNKRMLENHYGEQSHELFSLCKKFKRLSQDSDEFKRDFEETKEKILPLFVGALEYALTKVDATRTDKEIVKFINMAMMTKFIELQMQETGTKRVRTDGKNHYIKPVFDENTESKVWLMMIGKSLAFVGADAFDEHLTKSQKVLMMDVFYVVLDEYKKENVEFFHWDVNGRAYLNKRKMAETLGMSESNFKKRLKRIEQKIHENWQEVWSQKRKAM